MGLFDVFKKKDCEICGKEVGMLGYKKLEDGEICKDCVKLLSPWFEDRRHATVAQIKEQLAYRAENKAAVQAFCATKVIGENHLVYFDENTRRFFVAGDEDYLSENPDILSYDQVIGCELKIEEDKSEIMREITDKDGNRKEVSYSPRRFLYQYDFEVIIRVQHPYFDDMKFRLNNRTLELESGGTGVGGLFSYGVGTMDPSRDVEYRRFVSMGEEIVQTLTAAPQTEPAAPAAPEEPKPKFCPNCGAPADSGKFCQNCGSKLG